MAAISPIVRRPFAEYTGLTGYNFLAMVRRGFFYTFLMLYLRERLGLPVTLVALIGAANATSSTLGQILVWGRHSDRTDRRAGLMVRGELIAGLCYPATFVLYRVTLGTVSPVGTLLIVVACLATTEFFWSMTDVGFRAALAQVTTKETRGRFVGAMELTGLVGLGLGLLLAGYLYENGDGFRNGALWFLATGFILAGVPLVKLTLGHIDGIRVGPMREDAIRTLAPGFRRFMAPLTVAVVGVFCFQQNHTYFVRLADTAAATDSEISWIRTAFWIAGGLTAPLSGFLVDRLGSRRTYAAALAGCAVVPLAFLATKSVLFAAVSLAVFGAFLTAFRTASYTLTAELTPEEGRGRHFAVYNAVMSAGWGLAALVIGGPVADLTIASGHPVRTGYAASFVMGAALGLTGLALFGAMCRRGRMVPSKEEPGAA